MSEEQQEQIKQIEKDITSIAAWCVQENDKIDRLLERRLRGHGINR